MFNGELSAVMQIQFGVPQGSVLGPNLFVLYAAEVIEIAERHGFSAHAYADDLQLYDHADPPHWWRVCLPVSWKLASGWSPVDCVLIRLIPNLYGLAPEGTSNCALWARSSLLAHQQFRLFRSVT